MAGSTQSRQLSLIGVAAIVFVAHGLYLRTMAEDAFISLRFATNLAAGHGLVWNVGEPPVEGYTNFLWVLLCAAAIRLHLDAVLFSQGLGTLSALATLATVYRFGRKVFGWTPDLAILPPLLLASAGPFAHWAMTGMETEFFTLFVLLGCYGFARYWQLASRRSLLEGLACFLVAALTRPEGLLFGAVVVAVSLILAPGSLKKRLRDHAAPTVVCGAMFGAYFAWRWMYFGYPFPNTYYAKTGGGFQQVLRGATITAYFGLHFLVALMPWVLLAAWEAEWPARAPDRVRRMWASLRANITVSMLGVVCSIYTAYVVCIGGDYMAMHRFFVPILPLIYLLFGVVAVRVLNATSRQRSRVVVVAALLVITFGITFSHSTPLAKAVFPRPRLQNGNYEGVQGEQAHVRRLSLLGRFFNEYKRDSRASLATGAIGAIGYYADLRIYDFFGLVDTHIAHEPPPEQMGTRRPGHERSDVAYILLRQPTYVMFSRDLAKHPIDLLPFCPDNLRVWVGEHYDQRSVWLRDDLNGESGYFTFLERKK